MRGIFLISHISLQCEHSMHVVILLCLQQWLSSPELAAALKCRFCFQEKCRFILELQFVIQGILAWTDRDMKDYDNFRNSGSK